MTRAGRSIQVFGIYLAALGLVLFLAPNILLTTFGFEPTQEPWI